MERNTGKFRAALAAVALGVGIPALAFAHTPPAVVADDTSMQYDMTTDTNVNGAIANIAANTQALMNLSGLDESDVVPVSLGDMGLEPAAVTQMTSTISPSDAAALQQALQNVNVTTQQSPNGESLANYLTALNIDPHSVVAVDVGSDGTVTVYHQ